MREARRPARPAPGGSRDGGRIARRGLRSGRPGGRYTPPIDPLRVPRWLRALVVAGLALCLAAVYLQGGWRHNDPIVYQFYAQHFWESLAHPRLPTEYPPLSVLPFGLTLLAPGGSGLDAFALGMLALFAAGFLAFERWATDAKAWTYVVYALLAGMGTLIFRYDLLPALMVVAGIWLMERRRFWPVYALIGLGTLLKLFPLALLPVVVIAQWRAEATSGDVRPWRRPALGVGLCAVVVAAGLGGALLVDPTHALGSIQYLVQRPVEVESIPATLMWLGSFAGVSITPVYGHSSFGLTGSLGPVASAACDAVLVAGVLWVLWRQLAGRITASYATVAVLLLVICTSRVLCPQYLLWVVPALAAVQGFRWRWIPAFAMTALIFPFLWHVAVHTDPAAYTDGLLPAVAVRNVLLVACAAGFVLATPVLESAAHPDALPAPTQAVG